jgi:hypothetical protein
VETPDWLIVVSPYVNLAAIIVTAIATAILGWFTAVLARETRRMVDATSQPHIVATIEPNVWSMMHADLKVDNTGNATAYDIEVSFDPPLPREPSRGGENPTPLTQISVLKPGKGVSSYLIEFGPILQNTYTVSIGWKRDPAKADRQFNRYSLSMRDFDGVSHLGASNPLTQIATEVKKIRDDWQSVASGSRRVKTDVFSAIDRLHEQRQARRQMRRMRQRIATQSLSTQPSEVGDDGATRTLP